MGLFDKGGGSVNNGGGFGFGFGGGGGSGPSSSSSSSGPSFTGGGSPSGGTRPGSGPTVIDMEEFWTPRQASEARARSERFAPVTMLAIGAGVLFTGALILAAVR